MASPPCVFVHEFVTGGGWPPDDLPRGLAGEGAAMLKALLADFKAWGAVHTVTTLDSRLAGLALPADEIVLAEPGHHEAVFYRLLSQSDAVLIIAPETDGILAELSAAAERAGVPLLGSTSTAVNIAGNKMACYRLFDRAGLPTPPTRLATIATAQQIADEMGYPLVAKPIDGVGCEGVCFIGQQVELSGALALLRCSTKLEEILLQRYTSGNHASVSLLVSDGRSLPLSLNGQDIQIGCPCCYRGGIVPLSHPVAEDALSAAQAAVGLVPGLRGYVGVDLVLAEKDAYLIEINPRITSSYIGLRRVLQLNLAQAIWDACHHNRLPDAAPVAGQVTFTKDVL